MDAGNPWPERTHARSITQTRVSQGRLRICCGCNEITSQQGKKTENTFSSSESQAAIVPRRNYGKRCIQERNATALPVVLLITPSGIRIRYQIPFKTVEYLQTTWPRVRMTTGKPAAEMIKSLQLPPEAQVVVLGDTGYEAEVVRQACEERGYNLDIPSAIPHECSPDPKANVLHCVLDCRTGQNCRLRRSLASLKWKVRQSSTAEICISTWTETRKHACTTRMKKQETKEHWLCADRVFDIESRIKKRDSR